MAVKNTLFFTEKKKIPKLKESNLRISNKDNSLSLSSFFLQIFQFHYLGNFIFRKLMWNVYFAYNFNACVSTKGTTHAFMLTNRFFKGNIPLRCVCTKLYFQSAKE